MKMTEEQLAICWVYSNVWKVPPPFRKEYYSTDVDFENTQPNPISDYNNFGSGVFQVLDMIVSEDWKMSEWRRMLAMGDDYWPDTQRRLQNAS
jgi:hypothetical protein